MKITFDVFQFQFPEDDYDPFDDHPVTDDEIQDQDDMMFDNGIEE